MHHFSRNEHMLDTISVEEHCAEGAQLNWCMFLLNELLEACKDVFKKSTKFTYGYLVMTLTMWKWCSPEGRDPVPISDDQPLALWYIPWRTLGDPSSKQINEASFV